MRKLLALLAIVAIGAVGLISFPGTEAANTNATNTANISVTIAALTLVDAAPERLIFNDTALNPGSVGTGSGNLYEKDQYNRPGSIQIENIGSTNITNIWFNTTYESSNPFGTGDPLNYDSANFVTISKYQADTYYFVNRVDYNESTDLVYINTPLGWRYGRIRNTTYEYFWTVENVSDCAADSPALRIGINYHSQTVDGSLNFDTDEGAVDTEDFDEFALIDSGVSDVAYANIDTGPWTGYCAAVWDCGEKLMLYKWNKDAPGGGPCDNADYFWDNTSDGNLYPGNSTIADVHVHIPYGVMMGTAKEGTLTIIAMSDQAL